MKKNTKETNKLNKEIKAMEKKLKKVDLEKVNGNIANAAGIAVGVAVICAACDYALPIIGKGAKKLANPVKKAAGKVKDTVSSFFNKEKWLDDFDQDYDDVDEDDLFDDPDFEEEFSDPEDEKAEPKQEAAEENPQA